jgi:hypothetical protein
MLKEEDYNKIDYELDIFHLYFCDSNTHTLLIKIKGRV